MILLCTSKQHASKLVNYLNAHESECGGYFICTSKFIPDYMIWSSSIGVCYSYPWLINEGGYPKHITWYNFHPAPLLSKPHQPPFDAQPYGDWGNYSRGLWDLKEGRLKEWGVSLHLIDKGIDVGTVLREMKVPLMSIPDDIQELGDIGHYYCFQLFKKVIAVLHRHIPRTKEELDKLCSP